MSRLPKLQEFSLAAARAHELAGDGMITTTERRVAYEQARGHAMNLAEEAVPEVTRLIAELENEKQAMVAVGTKQVRELKARIEKLADRRDELEKNLKLWHQTRDHLPAIGLCCDREGCKEAIGIVGIPHRNLDPMSGAVETIARLAGWTRTENAPMPVRHYCPDHKPETP